MRDQVLSTGGLALGDWVNYQGDNGAHWTFSEAGDQHNDYF